MTAKKRARGRKPRAPSLNVRGEQPYVAVRVQVTLPEWGRVDVLVGEVLDWCGREGVVPVGAPFRRYRVVGGQSVPFDLEVGVPVAERPPGDGRIVAGVMPAGPYAVAIHRGHPDRLDEAHDELQEWVRGAGMRLATRREGGNVVWEGRFESFLTDPAEQPDPERWSTELAYLLELGTGGEA